MGISIEVDVAVPMRDGVQLATNIWRPADVEAGPVLLLRLPYGKESSAIIYGMFGFPNIFALVEAGYAVAIQDCRGTFRSGGEFVPFVNETLDGADSISWLMTQPWCDGNIGMYGFSYMGIAQWQTAGTGSAGLKALVPGLTSGDLYKSPLYSVGGALSLDCAIALGTLLALLEARKRVAAGTGDVAELVALAGALGKQDNLIWTTPVAKQPLLEKYAPWFQDWLDHPSRDEFWQQRSLSADDGCQEVMTPALHLGGWYDIFVGATLRTYVAMTESGGSVEARSGQRLVVGPWSHTNLTGLFPDRHFGLAASTEAVQLTPSYLAFFDRWLRGRSDALDATAPVRIFVMGIDRWRDEQAWPLPDTEYNDYFLAGGGRANTADGDGLLVTTAPESAALETYLYDPRRPVPSVGGTNIDRAHYNGPADQRPVQRRDDVLVFSTPVLAEDVEVTGPVTLTLHVSSSAVDTDFTGKLVDVHPDGRAIILCEGIQRMRYRTSLDAAELMEPGKIYEVTLDLAATSNVFLRGHRIRLEVSSSNFPRYDRNSNTGGNISHEREDEMIPAVNHVHHGPGRLSRLTLPIIRRP